MELSSGNSGSEEYRRFSENSRKSPEVFGKVREEERRELKSTKGVRTAMLSVIIPTYNEADNVAELIERIERSLNGRSFEIIVVDDNSPDGTAKIVEGFGKDHIKVLKRPKKLGLASAILDGMKVADGNIIAVMDADLQHPPELLPELLKKVEDGYDIAIASRYVDGGKVEEWSFLGN